MSLKEIGVAMHVQPRTAAHAPGRVLAALLDQWLPDFLLPREVRGLIDEQRVAEELLTEQGPGRRWLDETVLEGSPLTLLSDSPHPVPFQQLRTAAENAGDVSLRFVCALRHQPPARGLEARWYGRRVVRTGAEPGLQELLVVSLDWSQRWRSIRTTFTFAGYPLTAVAPELTADKRLQRAELPDVVGENRRLFAEKWRQLPELAGAEQVFWEVDAKSAFFEEDRAYLAELQAELSSVTGPKP